MGTKHDAWDKNTHTSETIARNWWTWSNQDRGQKQHISMRFCAATVLRNVFSYNSHRYSRSFKWMDCCAHAHVTAQNHKDVNLGLKRYCSCRSVESVKVRTASNGLVVSLFYSFLSKRERIHQALRESLGPLWVLQIIRGIPQRVGAIGKSLQVTCP